MPPVQPPPPAPPAPFATRSPARRTALTLALAGVAVSLTATPAAADSSACTHHFSGPQICVRLDGRGATNAVTGIWTNPPAHVGSRAVSLYRNGRLAGTATATRSGKVLMYTWPTHHTGRDTELCVKFRGSRRMACQTTR
ncbi:hypothetical protein [Streptomyces sp. SID1121]|uniref:hypothetical protein n=1 Tax=Streptomyces sp. SID1121 TaxID=3425888 RepID=UPI0040574A11